MGRSDHWPSGGVFSRLRSVAPALLTLEFPTGSSVSSELTLTADDAFYSPFAPTVKGGQLDTDLLVSRTTKPVRAPAETLARIGESCGCGDTGCGCAAQGAADVCCAA